MLFHGRRFSGEGAFRAKALFRRRRYSGEDNVWQVIFPAYAFRVHVFSGAWEQWGEFAAAGAATVDDFRFARTARLPNAVTATKVTVEQIRL